MQNFRNNMLMGLVAAAVIISGIPVTADAKDGNEQKHWRDDDSHGNWDNHGKRNGHRKQRKSHQRRDDDRDFKRPVRQDNRGHHNKPEIREDFTAIGKARNEVRQDRQELRKDFQELRKDRAELRRDIRTGAGKEETLRDRQEIRDDLKEIASDKKELREDQARLEAARRKLKEDLKDKAKK